MIYKITIDAFFLTPECQAALEAAKEDRDLGKSKFNILAGGVRAAVEYYASHGTPQVIIVEESGDHQAMMEHLGALAEVCEPGTKVVVIGAVNDITVYRLLISQGVSEYLVMPVAARDILGAILTIFADPSAPPRGRLVAFYGARGGVGSSVIAHNVAWSIANVIDDDVILIDMDAAFGTAGLAFNAEAKQTIADVLAQPDRVDAVLLERFMVKYEEHLLILPAAGNLRALPLIDVESLDRVIEIARQMAPFVVIDLPHIWTTWTEHVVRVCDELIITAQPDLPNLRDCKNLVDVVVSKRGEGAPTRLLINKVDAYKKTQLTAKDFQETLNLMPAATLAFEPNLFGTAANNGQMLGEVSKGNKVAETLRQLAIQLAGRQPVAKRRQGGFLGWLRTDSKKKRA